MNIVYLIGNGFDLNLKMETGYRAFYKYYLGLPEDGDSKTVQSFKSELKTDFMNGLQNWSDLELALGDYLKNLNPEEAVELHEHLVEHLSQYIKLEESKYPFDKDQRDAFCKYLTDPHKGRLAETESSKITEYRSRWARNWDVKIITFNYSQSVERLIRSTGDIGKHSYGNSLFAIYLSDVEHIHGFTDSRLILGVNDTSQIANKELCGDTRVTNRYVKSDCNNIVYRGAHDEKCRQWISKANLICTFGLSFGATDKKWWEAVGNALSGDCKMILFEYNEKKVFNANQGPAQLEEENRIKDRFLAQTTVEDSLKEEIKKNIYVAYNTDMFTLDIGKQEVKKSNPAVNPNA